MCAQCDAARRQSARTVPAQCPTDSLRRRQVNLNALALDARGEWLYFSALTGETVYRVRTLDLHNLNRHVERAQSLEVQQSKAIRTKVQRSAAPAVLGFRV